MSEGVRFAPSPTGRFHVGNLRTAWISYQWAKQLGEPWVLRFEDIDRPRVVYDARENQLADMQTLGMVGDRVYLQSDLLERHWSLFVRAVEEGVIYPCYCSRKEIHEGIASAPHGSAHGNIQGEVSEIIYTGHCRAVGARNGIRSSRSSHEMIGWRFKMPLESGAHDFVVARGTQPKADGLPEKASFVPSYHWACAIDDWDGDYTLLVRAWDLESAASQQRAIQLWMNHAEKIEKKLPAIFHCSLVMLDEAHRLEKRTQGVTLPELLHAGWAPYQIIEKFSESFSGSWLKKAELSQSFGESKRVITLADLRMQI